MKKKKCGGVHIFGFLFFIFCFVDAYKNATSTTNKNTKCENTLVGQQVLKFGCDNTADWLSVRGGVSAFGVI